MKTLCFLVVTTLAACATSPPPGEHQVELPRGVLIGDVEGKPPQLVRPDDGRPTLTCNGVFMQCDLRGRITRCWCSDERVQ